MRIKVCLLALVLFSFTNSKVCRAASFMDSLYVIGIGTVAGGILGASTLPFYDEPGENTSNIWAGAAVGAVVGVGVAVYSALSTSDLDFSEPDEVPDPGDYSTYKKIRLAPAKSRQIAIANRTKEILKGAPLLSHGNFAFWSPVADLRF